MTLLSVAWKTGISAVILAGVYCLWKRNGRSPIWWLLPVFCVLGMACLTGDGEKVKDYEQVRALVKGEQIVLKGNIKGITEEEDRERLTLELGAVMLEYRGHVVAYGNVMAYVDYEDEFLYETDGVPAEPEDLRVGMKVSLFGELKGFQKPGNPGEFDYGAYYHSLGIEGRFFGESLRVVDKNYFPFFDGICRIRKYGAKILQTVCTEKDRGILQAMVLGEKSELSEEIRTLYQRNGIAHLLAVSGLHISMMGMGIYCLCRKAGMGFGGAGLIGAAVTISYGVLAGGRGISASVVRAVVMVLMQMIAGRLGRTYDMRTAAAWAGLLLLLQSPGLLFQAGFQLSFTAVMALAVGVPAAESWLGIRSKAAKVVLSGAVIQLATCPIVVCHYFEYPIYGVFLNLAVIPLMPYVFMSGLLAIGAGTWSTDLGKMAVGTGHYVLEFYQWSCSKVQGLPGAVLITGRPKGWQMALYGALWIGLLAVMTAKAEKERRHKDYGGGRRKPGRWMFFLMSVCGSMWILLFQSPVKGMEVTFLDVGQGDGICIRTEEMVILVDGGSSDRKNLGKQVLVPFLKSQGIGKVDYAIVSHGDQDHISGLSELLEEEEGIVVSHVILPWPGRDSQDKAYKNLESLAARRGARIGWMRQGDYICAGKLRVECLYGEETETGNRNDHSPLVQVTYGGAGILLTGDISGEGEKRWLEKGEKLKVQVLKAAHHGSAYSTGEEFLNRIDPDFAVISCGEENRYGHPSPETIKRLEGQGVRWYATMDEGAVILRTDGEKLDIRVFGK